MLQDVKKEAVLCKYILYIRTIFHRLKVQLSFKIPVLFSLYYLQIKIYEIFFIPFIFPLYGLISESQQSNAD